MTPENPRSQVEARNVTRSFPGHVRERPDRWNHTAERADPEQRFFIYRLCECAVCGGSGKEYNVLTKWGRCSHCRGEGRTLDLVATAPTPEAVGTALVQLGREGEWSECPVGVLDTQGEKDQKWIVSPWLPSPRNVSDAGRVLQSAKQGKGKPQ